VISEKTVSSHISTILAKTGAKNRVAMAQLIHRLNARPETPTGIDG
jgi:DNA-binding CsgD family transcriptional regulator